jgi:hypothetical protein
MIPVLLALLAVDLPQFDLRPEADRCVVTVRSQQPMTAYWIGLAAGDNARTTMGDVLGAARTEMVHVLVKSACPDPGQQRVLAVVYEDGSTAGEQDYIAALLGARKADLDATQKWIRDLSKGAERLRRSLAVAIDRMPFSESAAESVIQGTISGRVHARALQVKKDLDSKGPEYTMQQLKKREALLLAVKPPIEP